MPSVRSRTILRLVLVATLSCSDSTGPGGPTVAIGAFVAGELATASEADTFALPLARLQQVVVILEPIGGAFVLDIRFPDGRRLTQMTADPSTTDAELFSTGLVEVESSGVYMIRVSAAPGGTGGAYRFRVVEALTGPEAASPTMAVQDTVYEMLEHRQDIDEFIIEAAPGAEVTVHARVLDQPAGAVLLVGYVQGGTGFVTGLSAAGDAEIDAGEPITLTAPASGRMVFRIEPTGTGRAIFPYPVPYEVTARF